MFKINQYALGDTWKPLLSLLDTEAVARKCFVKKVFLEISQNWQEKTYARVSFLIKLKYLFFIYFLFNLTLK